MYLMKSLDQALAVFDEKALRNTVSVWKCLTRHGFAMLDLVLYFEREEKRNKESVIEHEEMLERGRKTWEAVAPLCPTCGGPLNPPHHICEKKGTGNKKGWTCLWWCSKDDCMYSKYTHENASEEYNKLMERSK